jgi:hypothetical protein
MVESILNGNFSKAFFLLYLLELQTVAIEKVIRTVVKRIFFEMQALRLIPIW